MNFTFSSLSETRNSFPFVHKVVINCPIEHFLETFHFEFGKVPFVKIYFKTIIIRGKSHNRRYREIIPQQRKRYQSILVRVCTLG
jgi:hypothetical protein